MKSIYSRINSLINRFSCDDFGFSYKLSSKIEKTSALSLAFTSFTTPLLSRASFKTFKKGKTFIIRFCYFGHLHMQKVNETEASIFIYAMNEH